MRELVSAADGLIAVTPVFNGSYSGLFKMFFDALDPEALTGMPVLIARDRRQRAALAGARPRDAPALHLPARGRRTDRRLRRHRGLRRRTDRPTRITRAAAELASAVLTQGGYGVGGFAPDLAARPRRTSGTRVADEVTPFGELLRGHTGSD